MCQSSGPVLPAARDLPVPKFVDYDGETSRFRYDEQYRLKQLDWTYADEQEPGAEQSA